MFEVVGNAEVPQRHGKEQLVGGMKRCCEPADAFPGPGLPCRQRIATEPAIFRPQCIAVKCTPTARPDMHRLDLITGMGPPIGIKEGKSDREGGGTLFARGCL